MRFSYLASVLILAVAASFQPAAAKNADKPNIVFILVDDMGAMDGACLGSKYYQTPNLDRLAAGGMRFTQAYASCAVCSPTRAAIMTGKAPARLHITDWIGGEKVPDGSRFLVPTWQKHLPLEEKTLAEALKDLGYATAHVGKWHLGGTNFFPQYQGFDTNIAGGAAGHPASYFWPYGKPGDAHRVPGLAERGGKEGDYLTDQLTDEAVQFIEANRDRPFYVQLWHYTVHAPLMGKPELVEKYSHIRGSGGQSNAVYAAMVESMDQSVGRVMATLEKLGLTEKTIIVFTSDNGGAVHFGEPPATSNAPLRLGKGFAYEGGLRVPLIVKAPGVTQAGSLCAAPVISHDFFPTLLELAGAPRSAARTATDGKSFVSLLRDGSKTTHDALFWHYPHYWNDGKVSPYSVVRAGEWKLIRFYEYDREELYNLAVDPSESNNLSANHPRERKELAARLDKWLRKTGAQMPVARH